MLCFGYAFLHVSYQLLVIKSSKLGRAFQVKGYTFKGSNPSPTRMSICPLTGSLCFCVSVHHMDCIMQNGGKMYLWAAKMLNKSVAAWSLARAFLLCMQISQRSYLVYANNRGSCRLHGSVCRLACAIAGFIYSQTYIEKSSWGKSNIGCLTLFTP